MKTELSIIVNGLNPGVSVERYCVIVQVRVTLVPEVFSLSEVPQMSGEASPLVHASESEKTSGTRVGESSL